MGHAIHFGEGGWLGLRLWLLGLTAIRLAEDVLGSQ